MGLVVDLARAAHLLVLGTTYVLVLRRQYGEYTEGRHADEQSHTTKRTNVSFVLPLLV